MGERLEHDRDIGTERQNRELARANEILHETIERMQQGADARTLFGTFIAEAVRLAGAASGIIIALTRDAGWRNVAAFADGRLLDEVTGRRNETPSAMPVATEAELEEYFAKNSSGGPVWRRLDEPFDGWRSDRAASHRRRGHRGVWSFPLKVGGRMVGMLGMAFHEEDEPDAAIAESIETLARSAALALELTHLEHQVRRVAVEPRFEGAEVVARIMAEDPAARLIVLTTYDDDDDVERALRAGAKAYLLKDVSPPELVACVRAVHRGEAWESPDVAARLAERRTQVHLSPREMAVLRLIAEGRSNKQIAAAFGIAEGTVKIHTARVYDKLGVSTRTEATTAAMRRGLLRSP